MSNNMHNLNESPPTSVESDKTYCYMHPYCEWSLGCKGNHSFSPQRSEETVEYMVSEHVPNIDDEVDSGKPPCHPIEPLDDIVVPDYKDSQPYQDVQLGITVEPAV